MDGSMGMKISTNANPYRIYWIVVVEGKVKTCTVSQTTSASPNMIDKPNDQCSCDQEVSNANADNSVRSHNPANTTKLPKPQINISHRPGTNQFVNGVRSRYVTGIPITVPVGFVSMK